MDTLNELPETRWDGPLYVSGSVAHCYRDCDDMKQTARPYHGIDPYAHYQRVNACRYCLARWEKETRGKEVLADEAIRERPQAQRT